MSNREVMQQALEALCSAVEPKNGKVYARGFEPIDCYAMHEQAITALRTALEQQQAEPTPWRDMVVVNLVREGMRMPKVGDRVICLEDESLGEVVSLTAGGSPDIVFDDGSRGTYLLREFAELFGYVAAPQRQWVGLTDEEITELDMEISGRTMDECVRAIEAKLKAKNDH